MDVSVIIVNYNSSNYTLNCIDSIYKHTKDVKFEIIVVDNNSEVQDISKVESYHKSANLPL